MAADGAVDGPTGRLRERPRGRRRRSLGVVTAGLLLLVGALGPARADVVQQYEDRDARPDRDVACAYDSESSPDGDVYTHVCGEIEGSAEWLWIGRAECRFEDGFRRCEHRYGSFSGEDVDVVIDIDSGLASLGLTDDSCAVDVSVTGNGTTYRSGYSSEQTSPQLRTFDMRLSLQRGHAWGRAGEQATAEGSLCDWVAGEFEDAFLARYSDESWDRGVEVHPEEAPGGLVRSRTVETLREHQDIACAGWSTIGGGFVVPVPAGGPAEASVGGAGGDASAAEPQTGELAMACIDRVGLAGDGVADAATGAWTHGDCVVGGDGWWECTEESGEADDVDPAGLTIDDEAGTFSVDASIGDCPVAFDAVAEGDDYRWEFREDRSALGVASVAPPAVTHGYRDIHRWLVRFATPDAAPAVCAFVAPAGAESFADLVHYTHTTEDRQYVVEAPAPGPTV